MYIDFARGKLTKLEEMAAAHAKLVAVLATAEAQPSAGQWNGQRDGQSTAHVRRVL